ncbi:MAG: GDSL-type esterase/lipase family protein [Bacteroidaceae bacterium]
MKQKYLIFFCLLFVSFLNINAQEKQQKRVYSTYYYQRASLFEILSTDSTDIIFLGNSITDGGEWCELFHDSHIKNRGISGDTTYGVYDRLGVILEGKPAKIFLLIGINNLGKGDKVEDIVGGIEQIIKKIKIDSPSTQIYLQSILPTNDYYGKFKGHTSRFYLIPVINKQLKRIAVSESVTYIDLYCHFVNEQNKMNLKYSNDGLHLLGRGYQYWVSLLEEYINEK